MVLGKKRGPAKPYGAALALGALTLVSVAVSVTPGLGGALRGTASVAVPVAEAAQRRGPRFSDAPTDQEILRAGMFVQALVPVGPTTPGENKELAGLLETYEGAVRRGNRDAVEPFVGFIQSHPRSPWKPALEMDLGAVYRRTGHFSKAFETWLSAWDETKAFTDENGKAIGDTVAGYLSQLEAYLGRKETLAPLLDELRARPARGSAAELISESGAGLSDMLTRPDIAFKCGPSALASILATRPTSDPARSRRVLDEARSTPTGLSLTMVQKISVDAGMNYQMAFRSPGAPIVTPAVAHWRVGHYAALIGRDRSGQIGVADPTFGEGITMSPSTLNDEASGYFLVPMGELPEGWRPVDAAEGGQIWGRGDTGSIHDAGATGPDEVSAFPCGLGGGCTSWNVEAAVVGLALHDDPIGYSPPFGPPIRFRMNYSHRDTDQPATFTYTNFGNKWTTEWLSYVIDDAGCAGFDESWTTVVGFGQVQNNFWFASTFCSSVYRRGGGSEPYVFPTMTISNNGTQNLNVTNTSAMAQFSHGYLTRIVDPTTKTVSGYELDLPDGSIERYSAAASSTAGLPAGQTRYFMTEVVDPQGNTTTINYDSQDRIVSIVDALNQTTILCYKDSYPTQSRCPSTANQPPATTPTSNLSVIGVVDPFNRVASFGYDPGTGHLTSITDVLGIVSSYQYRTGTDFVTSLTTPYGTTNFDFTDSTNLSTAGSSRTVKITDPLNQVSEVEFFQGTTCKPNSSGIWMDDNNIVCADPALPANSTFPANSASQLGYNSLLQYRNTFIRSPAQYQNKLANPSTRYQTAKIIHWLHTNANVGDTNPLTAARTPESIKEPLESRVWFTYFNQAQNAFSNKNNSTNANTPTIGEGATNQPTTIARALDDGSLQVWQYQYNNYGQVTQVTDPVGRQLTMAYWPNGIDLQTITNTSPNTSDLLLSLGDYWGHQPMNVTGANGQTTARQFNQAGQVTVSRDPGGGVWSYTYSSANGGYLKSASGPSTATAPPTYAFTYDSYGRTHTVTGPDNGTTTYYYDAANRITQVAYPDQTAESFTYTNLDLTTAMDRNGNITHRTYDALRRLIEVDEPTASDPVGRKTKMAYWPNPAAPNPQSVVVTDPLGFATTYLTDIQGRNQTITYPDATQHWLFYDGAGRLTATSPVNSSTPGVNGAIQVSYNVDNTVSSRCTGTSVPCTTFSYDPAYPRLTSWITGSPLTSEEHYYYGAVGSAGANRLYLESLTLQDANSYVPLRNTYSTAPTVTQTYYTYDDMDRVVQRLIIPSVPSAGPTPSNSQWFYEYLAYDALGRLTSDQNAVDHFQYIYADGTNRVATRNSATLPVTVSASYFTPAAHNGALQQMSYGDTFGNILAKFSYTYDSNDNVTSFAEQSPNYSGTTSYGYDVNNELTSAVGPTTMFGNSTSYGYDLSGNMTSNSSNGTGMWRSGHYYPPPYNDKTTTYGSSNEIQKVTTIATGGVTTSHSATYDGLTGAMLSLGSAPVYTYDSSGRVLQAAYGTQVISFTYDGLGRLVQVLNKTGTTVNSNHTYAWCGDARCVEFDNTRQQLLAGESLTSAVPDRMYYQQGFFDMPTTPTQGQGYYEFQDGMGSVREVVNTATEQVAAHYEYDPLGNRTTIGGSGPNSSGGFAGYFYESATGLQFTASRAYAASLGRWLTRDPSGTHAFKWGRAFNATDLNLYGYSINNPQSWVDPSGLDGFQLGYGGGVGAIFGFTGGFGIYVGSQGAGVYSYLGAGGFFGASADWAIEGQPFTGDTPEGSSRDFTVGGGAGPDVNVSFNGDAPYVSGASVGIGAGAAMTIIDSRTWVRGFRWPWVAPGTIVLEGEPVQSADPTDGQADSSGQTCQ